MARTFSDFALDGTPASLSARWGMPRTLNAADGFYALGQELFLSGSTVLAPQERMAALRVLDGAARALVEALYEDRTTETGHLDAGVLYPAAFHLAGLFAGLDQPVLERLVQAGRHPALRELRSGQDPMPPEVSDILQSIASK
jgi:hypothetical protein